MPRSRVAGVAMITDGQIHDIPRTLNPEQLPGPVHVLLSGERNEVDRRLIVESAPSYGIVGKPQQLTLRIEDPSAAGQVVRVELRRDGGEPQTLRLAVGSPQTIDFTLDHGGPTLFEIVVEPGARELTLDNNRAVVSISGVRDRLRVLLVTGEPHAGERTWRNLLKSDPVRRPHPLHHSAPARGAGFHAGQRAVADRLPDPRTVRGQARRVRPDHLRPLSPPRRAGAGLSRQHRALCPQRAAP